MSTWSGPFSVFVSKTELGTRTEFRLKLFKYCLLESVCIFTVKMTTYTDRRINPFSYIFYLLQKSWHGPVLPGQPLMKHSSTTCEDLVLSFFGICFFNGTLNQNRVPFRSYLVTSYTACDQLGNKHFGGMWGSLADFKQLLKQAGFYNIHHIFWPIWLYARDLFRPGIP